MKKEIKDFFNIDRLILGIFITSVLLTVFVLITTLMINNDLKQEIVNKNFTIKTLEEHISKKDLLIKEKENQLLIQSNIVNLKSKELELNYKSIELLKLKISYNESITGIIY